MNPPPEGIGGANLMRKVGTVKKASDTPERPSTLAFAFVARRVLRETVGNGHGKEAHTQER